MVKVYDPFTKTYKEQIYNLPQAALAAGALYLGYRLFATAVEPTPSNNLVYGVKASYYSRIETQGLVSDKVSNGQTIRGTSNAIIIEYGVDSPESVATSEIYVNGTLFYRSNHASNVPLRYTIGIEKVKKEMADNGDLQIEIRALPGSTQVEHSKPSRFAFRYVGA